jgi:hypothetical protein
MDVPPAVATRLGYRAELPITPCPDCEEYTFARRERYRKICDTG